MPMGKTFHMACKTCVLDSGVKQTKNEKLVKKLQFVG